MLHVFTLVNRHNDQFRITYYLVGSVSEEFTLYIFRGFLKMEVVCFLRTISIPHYCVTWYFSDCASWIDYILITNLMHQLLFIHKIFSSTGFEPQVLIFRRIQLYTCSLLYCYSPWEFLVACQYNILHFRRA